MHAWLTKVCPGLICVRAWIGEWANLGHIHSEEVWSRSCWDRHLLHWVKTNTVLTLFCNIKNILCFQAKTNLKTKQNVTGVFIMHRVCVNADEHHNSIRWGNTTKKDRNYNREHGRTSQDTPTIPSLRDISFFNRKWSVFELSKTKASAFRLFLSKIG